MLNDPFRTSLTRDEIIGILLGWIQGPEILTVDQNDQLSTAEEELYESWSYSVVDDRENREEEAFEKRIVLREEGRPEQIYREPVEAFKRQDREFRRICDEFDDEISKGANSMLRVDTRSSTPLATCYTRKSFDEWVKARPDLSAHMFGTAAVPAPKLTKAQLQDEAILACIKELGHTANSLEPRIAGRKGIKAAVLEKLDGKEPFKSRKAFGNAWQRLRDSNKIREADPSPALVHENKRP